MTWQAEPTMIDSIVNGMVDKGLLPATAFERVKEQTKQGAPLSQALPAVDVL